MATIVQFNKIQSNEDILERLVSESQGTAVDIAVRNIPSLPASRINSGTFQVARIPSLPASQITSGTIDNARLGTGVGTVIRRENLTGTGSGLAVTSGGAVSVNVASNNALAVNSSGELEVSPLNLGNAHTFSSVAARNDGYPYDGGSQSSPEIVWNRGDIAIVTANTMTRTDGTVQLPGTPQVAETALIADSNTDRDTIAGYLTAAPPVANIYTVDQGVTGTYGTTAQNAIDSPTGTISIPAGVRFQFNNAAILFINPISSGNNNGYTIRTGNNLNNAFIRFTGPGIPGGMTVDSGTGLGTYVYAADDQQTAAATGDDDWELLTTPTATNLPASAITSGTLADARIPPAIARDSELPTVAGETGRRLTDISIAGNVITFANTGAEISFTGSTQQQAAITDRYTAPIAGTGNQTFGIVSGNGNQQLSPVGSSNNNRTFPTDERYIEVYIEGMLLSPAEHSNTSTVLTVTVPNNITIEGNTQMQVILRA